MPRQPESQDPPRADHGDPRQEAILRATLDLLRDGGYTSVTTDAIAARAGVSKSTLYRRWRNKTQLLLDAAYLEIPRVHVPDVGDFRDQVRLLLEQRLEQYRKPGVERSFGGLIGAAAENPEFGDSFSEWIEVQKSATAQIIQRAIARGEVRPDINVDHLTTLIAAPLVFRLVVERRTPDKEFVESILNVICRAIAVTPTEPEQERAV
ncbi:TetR family transcriptional regulator [Carbonactinospora thermoautotrophica]|uniref:TetR/AcrR family transcriptional regulator n=1 Tax=Carbonactinospora thermoautotrophica TaxID=1469144 RepID=UPI00226FBAF2|nr:TetR/AcrR family transcriptional regulator [Carbonactinospora thermoautotrophica]MCX9191186.1 TetR family transcriptional regulator [Carbonactinospora thermoautotrophica]